MHSQDIVFINYFPMMLVTKGIWDPYGFITANFQHFPYTYYGPALFFIISAANYVFIKVLHFVPLVQILEIGAPMMFKGFVTVDYVNAFSGLNLFGSLFLMKTPYLVFDFAIAWILLKLATTREAALSSYKLWMLNIVVLHSVYCVGKSDLIPAFFIISALLAAVKKRPYISVILLSLGGAAKLFPYILVLPTCLLLGSDWKRRLGLLCAGGLTAAATFLPFYLSSGPPVFGFFLLPGAVQYNSVLARKLLPAVFVFLYTIVSFYAVKDSRQDRPEGKLLYYLAVVMLIGYATSPVRFRYLVSATPLLALIIPHYKKLGWLILGILLASAFLSLSGGPLQMGLLAPVKPEYFSSLPSLNEIVGRFVNIEIVYKVMARALLFGFLGAAWWVWRIKSENENIIFDHRR